MRTICSSIDDEELLALMENGHEEAADRYRAIVQAHLDAVRSWQERTVKVDGWWVTCFKDDV